MPTISTPNESNSNDRAGLVRTVSLSRGVSYDSSKLKFFHPRDSAIDLDLDELECLQRYHTAFTNLAIAGIVFPLERQYTEADIGQNIQGSIIDWSTAHALEGSKAVDEIQGNMQYTVLQAALILTITIPLFINIPDLSSDSVSRAFSALVGFSAFSHITVVIGCTIVSSVMNRPYCAIDTLIARIEYNGFMTFITIMNYIAVITAVIATMIAGFDRKDIDGWIQIYSIGLYAYMGYMFVQTYSRGSTYQDTRAYRFYAKYCDADGQLKDQYIEQLKAGGDKKKD